MKTLLKFSMLGAGFVAGVAVFAWQRDRAATHRRSITETKHAIAQLTVDNERLRAVVATNDAAQAAQHVRAEIEGAQHEIATWERRLQQKPSAPVDRNRHFTANRDPEKGPVRLEHFRNQGQATPSAAFQTAVWAATTGADDALPSLFAISATGREKLRAVLSPMSPEMQSRYQPPEKLIGLLFARDLLDEEGFEIGATTAPDASGQVRLSVFRVKEGRKNKLEKKYPFVPSQSGWQFPISDAMIDGIPAMLAQLSMHVPPKDPAP